MLELLLVICSNFKFFFFIDIFMVVDFVLIEFFINFFKVFMGVMMIFLVVILLMIFLFRGYQYVVSVVCFKKRWCWELYFDLMLGGVVVKSISFFFGIVRFIYFGIYFYCIIYSGVVECLMWKKSVMWRKSRRILLRFYLGIQIFIFILIFQLDREKRKEQLMKGLY